MIPAQNRQKIRCVILAAGASTRLRPITDSMPKCLLKLGNKTLLERTIQSVIESGIEEIGIVVGYHGGMIREFVKQKITKGKIKFFVNTDYNTTNNGYSLLLTRKYFEDKNGDVNYSMLLIDSDILFSPKLLPFFLKDSAPNKISIRKLTMYEGEEVLVKFNTDSIINMIGKRIPAAGGYWESIGIELFSASTATLLFNTQKKRIEKGGYNEFYESSFQEMIEAGIKIKAVDISNFPAMEIDTPEDFEQAKQMCIERSHVFL